MALDPNPVEESEPSETGGELARSREGGLADAGPLPTVGLILGVLGGTALVFGAILYAIDPGVLPLAAGNIAFGVVCIIFYGATHRAQLARTVAGRSTPLIALEAVTLVGLFGGCFALNWLASEHPLEWDLTEDGIYSLHPQSVAAARRLEKPVQIYAFYRPQDQVRGILEQAVDLYRMHTDLLELELVHPDQAPAALVERFGLTAKSARIVFLEEASGRFTKIKRPTEEAITNALIEVAEERQRRAYFLTGHGEPAIDDATSEDGMATAATLLGNEGISVESLSLVGRSDVPRDTHVIVAAPQTRLLPNEVDALKVFLDRGGRALLLLEPGAEHGLERLLRPFGVDVGNDLLVDENPASTALGLGSDAPVVQSYEPHPITEKMGSRFSLFLRARSVSPRVGLAQIQVQSLIRTRPSAWAETRWKDESPDFTQDEADRPGPISLAVAVSKRTANHPRKLKDEGRLVVFGDQHFVNNRFSAMNAHVDLFVNTVNWLMGDEDRITIRPPVKTGDRLPLTELQQYGIMFFSVNLLPLLIVGLGFSVWAVRRRK